MFLLGHSLNSGRDVKTDDMLDEEGREGIQRGQSYRFSLVPLCVCVLFFLGGGRLSRCLLFLHTSMSERAKITREWTTNSVPWWWDSMIMVLMMVTVVGKRWRCRMTQGKKYAYVMTVVVVKGRHEGKGGGR